MANERVEGAAEGAFSGAAQGAAVGGVPGAIIGGVIGGIGGALGGGKRDAAKRRRRRARAAARKAAAATSAITGLQAARARRAIIRRAMVERASGVSQAVATGTTGSSGAVSGTGGVISQLQGELAFESVAQQLAKRGGVFSDEAKRLAGQANVFDAQAANISSLTSTAISFIGTGGGSPSTTPSASGNPASGNVTSRPSVFN